MQAIILAAGCGRRMRPLSDTRHKALLPIGGTTILARIVDELLAAGISRILLVTGYCAVEVETYLRASHPAVHFQFVVNDRFEDTNNVVSLSLALEQADPRCDLVLVECDLLLAPGLLAGLAEPSRGNVALLDHYRPGMDGTVVTVRGGVIAEVLPPDRQGADFEYRGTFKTLNIYRFTSAFVERSLRPGIDGQANEIDANAYYEVVLATLPDIASHEIQAQMVEQGSWAEVDDPNDLAAARFLFEPGARAEILDRTLGGYWGLGVSDFSFMRNAYFPSEAMFAAMRHALVELLGGYGSAQAVIDEKLAWFLRCRPARLEVLNGASQAFPILRELWADKAIAIPAPSFGEYSRMFPLAATYPDSPAIESELLERLSGEVDVLVLVNPNSPTGTTLRTDALYDLAQRNRQTLYLIDESFIDFSDQPSILAALEAQPLGNVLVLCSLSKSLGVPGLRLGYVYGCDRALFSSIARMLPVWNISSLAEYYIELLLKFRPELAASLQRTREDRDQLREALLELPCIATVHPSGGNFLLVELDGDATYARSVRRELLREAALEVKDVSARFPDQVGRLRIAVKRPAESRSLLQALARIGTGQTGGVR